MVEMITTLRAGGDVRMILYVKKLNAQIPNTV
jgi:hypothetical protein